MRNICLVVLFFLVLLGTGCKKVREQQIEKQVERTESKPKSFIDAPHPAGYEFGPEIYDRIKEARLLLAKEEAGFELKTITRWKWVRTKRGKRMKRYWTAKKLGEYNTLLAVLEFETGEIQPVWVAPNLRSDPPGFNVQRGALIGVGTRHDVSSPPGYIVLAIKRVIRSGNEYEEVINTPYSEGLDHPIVRRAGLYYLQNKLAEAVLVLKDKGIRSHAFPREQLADVVPLNTATTLSVIEHVDPYRFADEKPEQLVRETLVVVGANKEDAYRYAVSKAGARGLFQFIPSTYSNIRRQYPKAKLNPNFKDGMNDHLNAALANLLLLDSDWSVAKPEHRQFLRDHPEALGAYASAAYNGGAGRAAKAIAQYGGNWVEHLLSETRVYVRKYRVIEPLLMPLLAGGQASSP